MWSHSPDINFLQEADDLERSLSDVVNEEEKRRLKQEIKILRTKRSLAESKYVRQSQTCIQWTEVVDQ